MVTTAFNNVINLQPGGSRISVSANRILLECRELGARRLREASREMLQKVGEALRQRSDVAKETDERRFLRSLADQLNEKSGRVDAQLAVRWGREFDLALKGSAAPAAAGSILLEDMQIVEYGAMDEEIAVKALARRLADKFDEELYGLGRRFNELVGVEGKPEIENPAAPGVVCLALQGALQEAGFETKERLELYRCFEGLVIACLGPIFHAINAHLLHHNVLPNLRRDYGRTAGLQSDKDGAKAIPSGDMFAMLQKLMTGGASQPASPQAPAGAGPAMPGSGGGQQALPASYVWASLETLQHAPPAPAAALAGPPIPAGMENVLHHFRSTEVGQGLGQLDAITVDIVAMLFDMIFDDRDISDPIKALVGKLQIPVLKVAMLDRSFFSSKAHPTRRLLDLISRAALRWGQQIGHDDPVYRKIAEVIENLHTNFKQDTALFESLCDDLQNFLGAHEEASAGKLTRAALLVVQRELEELAGMAVASELHAWLAGPLPTAVTDLLDHEWRAVLVKIHLEDGPDSEAWQKALATAGDLVDSVSPRRNAQERQVLARRLPELIKALGGGFERIKVDGDRRRALLDGLFSLHAASLRGAELPPPAPIAVEHSAPAEYQPEAEPSLACRALDDGEIKVESISLESPATTMLPTQDVGALQRGDWVEYTRPNEAPVRYRLSWISPQRGIFLLTNPESPNAIAISPEAMSLQVQRGEVRILSTEPIFDRALTRTIDILQAA